MGFVVPP